MSRRSSSAPFALFVSILVAAGVTVLPALSIAQNRPDIVWSSGVGKPRNVVFAANADIHAIHSEAAVGSNATVRLVRTSDRKLLHTYTSPTGDTAFLAISPNGQFYATGGGNAVNPNRVYLFRVVDGTEVWHADDPGNLWWQNGPGTTLAFSADGTKLIHGSQYRPASFQADGTVVVRDVATGVELRRFEGGRGTVNPVTNEVAILKITDYSIAANWSVKFYDLSTGTASPDEWVVGHDVPFLWTGDGLALILALASPNSGARAIRRSTGLELSRAPSAFASFGHLVYFGANNAINVWDVNTGATSFVADLTVIDGLGFNGLFASQDGQTISIAATSPTYQDGRLFYYDAQQNTWQRDPGHGLQTDSLAIAPDGQHFATASSWSGSNEVAVWETATGTLTARYAIGTPGTRQVKALAWSRDGLTLAVATNILAGGGETRLVNALTGNLIQSLPLPAGVRTLNLQFSSDGSKLATTDTDNSVRIWDMVTVPTPSPYWLAWVNYVYDAAFSPATSMLAVAHAYNFGVLLYDWPITRAIGVWPNLSTNDPSVRGFSFSSDGNKLAFMHLDATGAAFVCDLSGGGFSQIHQYSAYPNSVHYACLAIDPGNSRYLLRGYGDPLTGDMALGIYDTNNPNPSDDTPVVRYDAEVGYWTGSWPTKVAYTPDGKYFVYTISNGNIVVARNPNAPPDNTNHPPVAAAGSDQTVTVAHGASTATFTLDGSPSSDPDSDALSYEWSESGSVLATTAMVNLSRGPGSYTFDLKVTDVHGASSTDSVIITVAPPPNATPVLTVPYSVLGVAGQPITFTAKATDSDGDAVSFSLMDAPAGMTINSGTGVVNWTPPQTVSGTFDFHVVATDPYGGSDIKPVTITVNPAKSAIFKLNQSNLILTRTGNTVTASFDIDNTSTGTALDVGISVAQLQNKANFVKYQANKPLPGPFTIPGQSSQAMSVSFTGVPAGINATLTITLVYDGGSVNFSRVVVVP